MIMNELLLPNRNKALSRLLTITLVSLFMAFAAPGASAAGPPQKKTIPKIDGIDGTTKFKDIKAEVESEWGGKYLVVMEVDDPDEHVIKRQYPDDQHGDQLTQGQYMHFLITGSGGSGGSTIIVAIWAGLASLLAAWYWYRMQLLRKVIVNLQSDDSDDD